MLFETFTPVQPADSSLCARYQNRLPEALRDVWQKYGFGTFLNGYLKMVNPEDYQDLLRETCVLGNTAVPIFATSLADLVVWDRGRCLRILHYPVGTIQGISAARLGVPAFHERFGCVPLPTLGSSFRPENLRRCSLQEHIALICQTAGVLGL